jgi:hypothetical protein
MLAWFVFDMALDMLYSLLESFTLEEHEKAQRQYDKERKELGDVDDEDKAGTNMIISFTEGRIFRYVFWGVVISSLLSMLNAAGTAVSEELAYMRDTPSPEVTKANLAKINPWRDFLPEQDPVLREGKFAVGSSLVSPHANSLNSGIHDAGLAPADSNYTARG